MDLSQINKLIEVNIKPLKKLNELPVGTEYPINSAKIVNGRFKDRCILIETVEFNVFLPGRMTPHLEEHLDDLKNHRFKYLGAKVYGGKSFQEVSFI